MVRGAFNDGTVEDLKDVPLLVPPVLLPPIKLSLAGIVARLLMKLLLLLLLLLLLKVVTEVAKDSCIVGRLDPPHAVGVGLGNSAVAPVVPAFLDPKLETYSHIQSKFSKD